MGWRYKAGISLIAVGTPPPDDTWHTLPGDTWHTFLSGLIPSGFSQEYTWRASPIQTPKEEAHDTRKHHIRTTAISHPNDRHILSGYVLSGSLTKVSKSYTSFQQPTTTHVPSPAEWKDRNEVTASHFPRSLTTTMPPTISVSRP